MLVLPVFARAAQKSAEEIVLSVKERVEIPEGYTEFSSNIDTSKQGTQWNLSWSKPQTAGDDYGNLSVSVNDGGRITYIYSYDSNDYSYSGTKKLPTVNKDDAKNLAVEFAKRVNPDLAGVFDFSNPEVSVNRYDGSVNITFYRAEYGVPYLDNNVSVGVSGGLGRVTSYSLNYSDYVDFPARGEVIGEEKAVSALAEKGAVGLVYTLIPVDGKNAVSLMYVPRGRLEVNAQTGELLEGDNIYYYARDEAFSALGGSKMAAPAAALTEEERAELERLSGLISAERAEEILRATPELAIPDDAFVEYSSISRAYLAYPGLDYGLNYIINLNMTQNDSEGKYAAWIYATLNAETGEIIGFGRNENSEKSKEKKLSREAAAGYAKAFLEKYKAEKFGKLVEKPQNTDEIYYDERQPSAYFYYTREENGIEFEGNYVNIAVDLETGAINSYNQTWIEAGELPDPSEAIAPFDAAKTIAQGKAPVLAYVNAKPLYYAGQEDAGEIVNTVLAYTIRAAEFKGVDAFTGYLLGHDGEVYYNVADEPYTDIEGHYAKGAIEALAEIGIRLPGAEFNPDSLIKQKEFAELIAQCVLDYYPMPRAKDTTSEVYSLLIRKGVMDKSEQAPEANLIRETAVKYLLSAMGLGEVGSLTDIYANVFSDFEEISPGARGFAALAKGLGIINGQDGAFMPQREMTRAEAITIIYNYLAR